MCSLGQHTGKIGRGSSVICLLLKVNLGSRLLLHPSSCLYSGRCLFQKSPSFPATFPSSHLSHSLPWLSLGHFHCLQLLHLEITWGTTSYLSSLLGWLHPISACWVSEYLYSLGPPQCSFPSLEPTLQYCNHPPANSHFPMCSTSTYSKKYNLHMT